MKDIYISIYKYTQVFKTGFFVMLAFLILATTATPTYGYEVYNYNGHSYTLTQNWGDWTAAEQEAVNLGGHLVTINDAAENTWLTNTFKDTYGRSFYGQTWQNAAWIGYYYDANSQSWKWISGEPVTYYTYASNWPIGGTHAYLTLAYHPWPGVWGDNYLHEISYNYNFKGIIEYEASNPGIPEFPTVALPIISVIALMFLVLRRKQN